MASSTKKTVATTRDQIVRVAKNLVETRSYLGFSFQDVADQVGIRKASLYHHFPSKESLGIAVIHAATQSFRAWAAGRVTAPEQAIEAYIRLHRNTLRAGKAVCPAGALIPGWDCIDRELRAAVSQLRSIQILWLKGVLEALGQKAGAGAMAAHIFATCQGALLSARVGGRPADFDAAVAQLRQVLPRLASK